MLLFKSLLLLSNCALLGYLLKVMIFHHQQHYDLKSWASIFHYVSLVWLLTRCTFWVCTILSAMEWNNFSFYLLYWIPTTFEFITYMVLPLYFAQVLYPDQWNAHWLTVRPLYFGGIVTIFFFEVIWSYLSNVSEVMLFHNNFIICVG
jgi:hypothetical protein